MLHALWFLFLLPANINAVQSQIPLADSEDDWNLNTLPNPNATGHLVFDTVSSLLQNWPNTRYYSGLCASIASGFRCNCCLKVIPLCLAQFQRARCYTMAGTTLMFQPRRNGSRPTLNLRASSTPSQETLGSSLLSRLARCVSYILTEPAQPRSLMDRWTCRICSPGHGDPGTCDYRLGIRASSPAVRSRGHARNRRVRKASRARLRLGLS
jgi:hypothetical protein